jgi:hypothetical protein
MVFMTTAEIYAKRLFEVLRHEMGNSKLFEKLQNESGISAESWKGAAYGKQKPTLEMMDWTYQRWPQYAYWLATGALPSLKREHTSPDAEKLKLFSLKDLCKKEPKDWNKDEFEYVTGVTFSPYEHNFKNPNAIIHTTFILHNAYINKKTIEQTLEEFNQKMDPEKWRTVQEGIEGLAEMGFNVEKYGF